MSSYVLNPISGETSDDLYAYAARKALRIYANIIKELDPELSVEIIKTIEEETSSRL